MVERWKAFDWRAVEARINAYPNFLTEIDGQTVHFVHVRSAVPDAAAAAARAHLSGLVPRVPRRDRPADRPGRPRRSAEDAFHVVVPSMPGFGFSTPVVDGGWTMARVAGAYDALMRRLGYDSYGIHGSDGGAMVARELAILDPEGFLGAHVLQLFSFPSGDPGEFDGFGPKEYAALEHLQWFQSVGGYNSDERHRARRPSPPALSDSPVGHARLHRAVRELRQRHQPGARRSRSSSRSRCTGSTNTSATAVAYHYEEGALRGRARGQPAAASGSPSSRTTSRRSGSSPSATTRTSPLVGVRPRWPLRRPRGARGVVADLRTFFARV